MPKPTLKTLARALDDAERYAAECIAELALDEPECYAARRARDAAAMAYSQAIFSEARVKVDRWRARKTCSTQSELTVMRRAAERAEQYLDAVNGLVSARDLQDANVAYYLATERYEAAECLNICSLSTRAKNDAAAGIRRVYR